MTRVALLVLAGLLLIAGTAQASPTGRLLVTLDAPAGKTAHAAAARALVAATGARPAEVDVPQIGLVAVRPPSGTAPAAFARQLRRRAGVAHVEAERRFTLRYAGNDPALSVQEPSTGAPPGTPVEWWAARQSLPEAWDHDRGENATVAIIDTGIDAAHPEFAGRIRAASADEASGSASTDEQGHGTHVASLACAAGDNGFGLAGAGFGCGLMIYKSDFSTGSVARAIVGATDGGADAINMSFGDDGQEAPARAIVDAIDYAYEHNVLMTSAAADTPTEEQGDPPNVLQPTGTGPDIEAGKGLSVTAANFDDQRASFAGRGTQISMAAYGAFQRTGGPRGIFGAFPANQTGLETGSAVPPSQPCGCRATFNGDNRYAYVQGTSMAAPMVAAVGALMRDLNPDLRVADIIRLLKETASRPAGSGWGPELGWGILNAGAALRAAAAVDRRPPTSRVRAPRRTHLHRFTLRIKAGDPSPPGVVATGLAKFRIFRSSAGRPARRIATTRAHTLKVRGTPGHTYTFYSVAIDVAGNVEAAPKRPDARVTVLFPGA